MPNEAGIGLLRTHFVRETIPGVTQTDPDWILYSDEIQNVGNWLPNVNIAARTRVGSPDVSGFSIGAEDHELTIMYALQKALTAGGLPNDAIADAFLRSASGYLINTHSIMIRQTLGAPEGSQGSGVRIFTYGRGGKFDTASLSGDPATSEPIMAEGTYRFEKVRSFEVSQPTAPGTLTVVSTDAGDTTQTLTIENEGAGATEAIALNGTTPVVGAVSFADIDSFRLDAETLGTVIVTFTVGGQEVFRILGSVEQQDIEGDLGMALLGSGSFETPLGTAFEHILGDLIELGGSPLEPNQNLMTLAFNVANNIQVDAVVNSKSKVLSEGFREATAAVTIFSPSGSHAAFVDHLRAQEEDLEWNLTLGPLGQIQLNSAVLTGPGARIYEKGEATMRRDNTFTGQGYTITP